MTIILTPLDAFRAKVPHMCCNWALSRFVLEACYLIIIVFSPFLCLVKLIRIEANTKKYKKETNENKKMYII